MTRDPAQEPLYPETMEFIFYVFQQIFEYSEDHGHAMCVGERRTFWRMSSITGKAYPFFCLERDRDPLEIYSGCEIYFRSLPQVHSHGHK